MSLQTVDHVPFRVHAECIHQVGDDNHACGRNAVAFVVTPLGWKYGRCRQHAISVERAIEAGKVSRDYHIEWRDEA